MSSASDDEPIDKIPVTVTTRHANRGYVVPADVYQGYEAPAPTGCGSEVADCGFIFGGVDVSAGTLFDDTPMPTSTMEADTGTTQIGLQDYSNLVAWGSTTSDLLGWGSSAPPATQKDGMSKILAHVQAQNVDMDKLKLKISSQAMELHSAVTKIQSHERRMDRMEKMIRKLSLCGQASKAALSDDEHVLQTSEHGVPSPFPESIPEPILTLILILTLTLTLNLIAGCGRSRCNCKGGEPGMP